MLTTPAAAAPITVATCNMPCSVLEPSAALAAAAAASVREVEAGSTEFSSLLTPLRRTTWVASDGVARGVLLLEGASISVRAVFQAETGAGHGNSPRLTTVYEPVARPPLPV